MIYGRKHKWIKICLKEACRGMCPHLLNDENFRGHAKGSTDIECVLIYGIMRILKDMPKEGLWSHVWKENESLLISNYNFIFCNVSSMFFLICTFSSLYICTL